MNALLRQSITIRRCRRHSSSNQPSQVTFSGIQPTSIPHIGNYFGAIKLWVDIQNDQQTQKHTNNSLIISIVDLHALTLPKKASILKYFNSTKTSHHQTTLIYVYIYTYTKT